MKKLKKMQNERVTIGIDINILYNLANLMEIKIRKGEINGISEKEQKYVSYKCLQIKKLCIDAELDFAEITITKNLSDNEN